MSSKAFHIKKAEGLQPMPWEQRGTLLPPEPKVYAEAPRAGEPNRATSAEIERLKAALAQAQARNAELEQRARDAQAQGRREGETSVRQAFQAEQQALLQKLAQAISETVELRPRLRLQAESDLVRLSVAIARRILHRELNADPDSIGALVRVGLEKLRSQEVTRVRVHTGHQQALKTLLGQSGSTAHVEIAADPSQERGTVVFETARGNLDLSLETQLREIERGLTDRFR